MKSLFLLLAFVFSLAVQAQQTNDIQYYKTTSTGALQLKYFNRAGAAVTKLGGVNVAPDTVATQKFPLDGFRYKYSLGTLGITDTSHILTYYRLGNGSLTQGREGFYTPGGEVLSGILDSTYSDGLQFGAGTGAGYAFHAQDFTGATVLHSTGGGAGTSITDSVITYTKNTLLNASWIQFVLIVPSIPFTKNDVAGTPLSNSMVIQYREK